MYLSISGVQKLLMSKFCDKNFVLFSKKVAVFLSLHPSHTPLQLQWVGPSLGPKCHACHIPPSFTKPFVKDTQFFHIKQLAIEDGSVNHSF
jgi:hypothetical protein